MPKSYLWELLVRRVYEGHLMGHFGVRKTIDIWMITTFSCTWREMLKGYVRSVLLVIKINLEFYLMNYSMYPYLRNLGLTYLRTIFWAYLSKKGRDYVFVAIDKFLKITHFIPYYKTHDATNIMDFFFKEILCLHGILRTIVFDWDIKLISYFWKIL